MKTSSNRGHYLLFWLIVVASAIAIAQPEQSKFDLKTFDGTWSGSGEAIIPGVRIPISIEGLATFAYDSVGNYLRTSIEAKKFFFTYSDSGYLYHDRKTDSITWKVWDGFGEFGIYRGAIEDGVLHGILEKDKWLFNITIDFVTADSMVFNMTAQKGYEGDERPKATISLWRQ